MKRKKEKQFRSLFEYYGFTEKEAKEYPVVTSILKELTPERIKERVKNKIAFLNFKSGERK